MNWFCADVILKFGAGPLILSWVNEICSGDTEKRALLVAAGNDLAYVVQAVAPNFVWKTTDFPAAIKGYNWSIVLQVLLSEFSRAWSSSGKYWWMRLVLITAAIQLLLWRDKKRAAKAETVEDLPGYEGSESPQLEGSDVDEKRAVRTKEAPLTTLE
jgi:ACS family pantothenate transporter-like MFS transporter